MFMLKDRDSKMDILRKLDLRSAFTFTVHCHRSRPFTLSKRRFGRSYSIGAATTATPTAQNQVDMTTQKNQKFASQPPRKTSVTTAGTGASNHADKTNPATTEQHSKLKPVNALEIPEIQERFRTRREYYSRPDSVLVQGRLADPEKDGKQPLITWIVDHKGKLLRETTKVFTAEELKKGIVILRYPDPIAQKIYNEWFVTREKFEAQYKVGDGQRELSGEFRPFQSKVKTRKEGITIDETVIKLLGGEDGLALVEPPWGGEMYAVLDGLLTAEGSCIGPEIVRVYYDRDRNDGQKS